MADNRKDRDFTRSMVTTLGERAHFLCSNPKCQKMTTGPHSDNKKSLRSGEAAHIYSVNSKIARYNNNLSDEEVRDMKNGIWLCRDCHKQVDHDETIYPAGLLFHWKKTHEAFVKALRSNPNKGILRLIQPTIDEEVKAREVLDYLDDKRALNKDFQFEIPSHVFQSLQDTRRELVKKKKDIELSFLRDEIDKVIKAIRQFLDTIYDIDINNLRFNQKDTDWIKFENSLSTLRKMIGFIVAEIADKYNLQLGYELKKITPEN